MLVPKDSDQGDEDRQADENKNKHKQDIYDHGYSDQRRDSDSKEEESKRSENSQRENDRRQVPLRDSSENRGLEGRDTGVQVVSPTENSTSKWANIIKVNFSNFSSFVFLHNITSTDNLERLRIPQRISSVFQIFPKIVFISNHFQNCSKGYPTYEPLYRFFDFFSKISTIFQMLALRAWSNGP